MLRVKALIQSQPSREREKMSVRKQTGRANAADEKEVGGSHLAGGEPKTDRQTDRLTGRQAPEGVYLVARRWSIFP